MTTPLPATHVESVVKRGWRRRLFVLAVDYFAPVIAAVFVALALLILLGTDILAWQWLLAIAFVGIAFVVISVRRKMADPYRVAQLLDDRLSLHDSLSTAWFLSKRGPAESQVAAAFQLNRAEEIAQRADPAAAFPFQRRRAWLANGALFLLAFGLFSARYFVTRELNLQRPFLPLTLTQVFENFRKSPDPTPKDSADGRASKSLPPGALGRNSDRTQAPNAESQQNANQPSSAAAANGETRPPSSQDTQQSKNIDGKPGDQNSNSGGDPSQSNRNQQASNTPSQGDSKENDPTGPQHSNSLMDRMRDALSSVMAKIKPSGAKSDSQASNQKGSAGQKNDQAGNKNQSGDGQKDAGKEQSAQEQSSGEQQGQGAAKAQASQGKDSSQASDKKGSDAQSGVGHSDGDKELREAEQARAMGKLAEIIGKRSASVTGDMQIEPSGKQRLETAYTHEQGKHADLGGEINRDEISVEDQEYVREYMELVRKQAAHSRKP